MSTIENMLGGRRRNRKTKSKKYRGGSGHAPLTNMANAGGKRTNKKKTYKKGGSQLPALALLGALLAHGPKKSKKSKKSRRSRKGRK